MCNRILIILLLFLPVKAINAQSKGCTDIKSPSYNASATVNDGSCTYGTTWFNPTKLGSLPSNLSESSGLVFWDNLLWTNNDSGSEAEIYGIDPKTRSIVRKVKITNASNVDWEDMATNDTHLFIGDIGNNEGNRKDLKILKIPLEQLKNAEAEAEIIEYEYEDQFSFESLPNNNNFDAEAIIAFGDSLYIFSKNWVDLRTRLYAIPNQSGKHKAKLAGEIYTDGMITGATFNGNDSAIILVGYNKLLQPLMWLLWDYQKSDFFSGNKRKINLNLPLHQVEAITWSTDNQYYITNEALRNIQASLFNFSTQDWIPRIISSTQPNAILSNNIFPNPAKSTININASVQKNSIIRLYNELGRQVHEEKTSIALATYQINVQTLRAGMYFVEIESENNFEIGRFIKAE